MYIGLIDDDLRLKSSYPNLELMKIASFHKYNRDIVELVRDYRTYERYSKLILRKNTIDNNLPNMFLSKTRGKCEYGGYAFTNGIYIPMQEEIEKQNPDCTIYDKILKERPKFKTWLRKNLIRLETHNKPIISENNLNSFLVYDKNVYDNSNFEELVDVAKTIELVEPQCFNDFNKAVSFACIPELMVTTIINYNGEVNASMAAATKEEPFKNYIYYNIFPEQYSNVSFEAGCAILAEYISKIRSINRYNFYLKPKNIFLHNSLAQLVHYMSSPGDIKNKLQHIPSKNRDFVLQRYPTLITQIQMLRRYKNDQ